MPQNLTTEEVAERFRTSPETVRYWRHVGKGPCSFKVGRRVLYRLEDVETWERAARGCEPAPPAARPTGVESIQVSHEELADIGARHAPTSALLARLLADCGVDVAEATPEEWGDIKRTLNWGD